MSAADVSTPPPMPGPAPDPTPAARPRGRLGAAAWGRVALACGLLLGSAAVRAWQARRIEGELQAGRQRPRFDLKAIPMQLGRWQGKATEIDPQIARNTGADQIVTRRYVNQDTGATVDVIMLYGPAAEVYLHAPEICYPAAGFSPAGGPDDRAVSAGPYSGVFRELVYSKGEGAQVELQEVYYAWWYNGLWTPQVGKQKYFERIPGMYKLHLARRTTAAEKRDVGNPCEALIREVLPEIERRMAAAQSPTP